VEAQRDFTPNQRIRSWEEDEELVSHCGSLPQIQISRGESVAQEAIGMSHYEEIVAEYLCFGRTRFVSPGFSLDLGGVGPQGKGRNWWIDVLAVDFKEQTIYLCEATFARNPTYMFARLRAWTVVWPEICENLFRITHAPHSWTVKPWIFTPYDLKLRIEPICEAVSVLLIGNSGLSLSSTS
jgi:hypothetical protein